MDSWLAYIWAHESKGNIEYLCYTYFEDASGFPGDMPYPQMGTLSELANFYIETIDKQNFQGQVLVENKIPTDSAFKDEDWFYFTRDSLYRKLSENEMEQFQKEIIKKLSSK